MFAGEVEQREWGACATQKETVIGASVIEPLMPTAPPDSCTLSYICQTAHDVYIYSHAACCAIGIVPTAFSVPSRSVQRNCSARLQRH